MQGDRAPASYQTNDFLVIIDISRLLRLQTRGQGAIASGIRRQCRTSPTGLCRARRRSIVKAAALYTNWLAPGFNIDSRECKHSFIKVQTAFVKLSSLDCLCDGSLTSTPNNSSGTLAKTIKTINCSFLPPYNVYLTWLAMRLPYLLRGLRRIQEVSEYKKSRQKQQFFTKNDKHLY